MNTWQLVQLWYAFEVSEIFDLFGLTQITTNIDIYFTYMVRMSY